MNEITSYFYDTCGEKMLQVANSTKKKAGLCGSTNVGRMWEMEKSRMYKGTGSLPPRQVQVWAAWGRAMISRAGHDYGYKGALMRPFWHEGPLAV